MTARVLLAALVASLLSGCLAGVDDDMTEETFAVPQAGDSKTVDGFVAWRDLALADVAVRLSTTAPCTVAGDGTANTTTTPVGPLELPWKTGRIRIVLTKCQTLQAPPGGWTVTVKRAERAR